MADLTIIIPSYNNKRDIIHCINSLKDQKAGNIDYDIIVVDSSTDGTPDLIRERFPDLKVIHSPRRLFPGGARNAGIEAASSRLIAFLDSDCIAEQGWIDNLVRAISRLNCEIVGGAIKTSAGLHIFGAVSYLTEFSEYMPGRATGKAGFVPTCNMIFKRTIFDEAGGFLEDMLKGSDRVFVERVKRKGGAIYFCPEAVVRHNDDKDFFALMRKQVNLGFGFAQSRRLEGIEGYIFVKLPFLVPAMPGMRIFRLFYRLIRFHEYRYLLFALLNILLVSLAYCSWTFGAIKGIIETRRTEG